MGSLGCDEVSVRERQVVLWLRKQYEEHLRAQIRFVGLLDGWMDGWMDWLARSLAHLLA